MRKRTWKIFLLAGGTFCLVLVVALAAISVYVNSGACRTWAVTQINAMIHGQLVVEGHRVDVVAGRMVLSDINLNDTSGKTIAGARQLSIQIRWIALLGRSLHIASFIIDEPFVSLVYDEQDRLNLSQIVPLKETQTEEPADASGKWQLRLDRLQISSGRTTIERPSKLLSGNANRINVSASGDLHKQNARLNVSIGLVDMKVGEKGASLNDIEVSALYRSMETQPIHLSIQSPKSRLTVEGRLGIDHERPTAAMVGDFDIDMEELLQWSSAGEDVGGKAQGRVTLNGPLFDPSAAMQLTLSNANGWGASARALELKAILDRRVVDIERLSAEDHWGSIDLSGRLDLRPVFPRSFEQAAAGFEAMGLELAIKGHDVVPSRVPAVGTSWPGVWNGQVRIQGSLGRQSNADGQAEIDLRVKDLKAEEATSVSDGEFLAYLRWSGQKITIDSCQAKVGDTTLQANGVVDWGARELVSSLTVRSDRIGALGEVLGISLPSGKAILKLDAQGPWQRLEAHGALLTQEVVYAGWRFGRLLAEADLKRDGTIRFSRLVLENQGSYLEGKGEIRIQDKEGRWLTDPSLSAIFELNQVALADFHEGLDVNASLNGRLRAEGTLAHPHATLDLSPSPIAWKDIEAQTSGRILWEDGCLRVLGLSLASGQSRLSLKGDVQWRAPENGAWLSDPRLTATLISDAVHLEDFRRGFGGRLDIQASVTGTFSNLNGACRLDGTDLDLKYQKLESVHLNGRLIDRIFHVDEVAVAVAPGEVIRGDGWYAFDRRIEARLTAEDVDLRHIDGVQKGGPVAGKIEGAIDARGMLPHPHVSGHILIRQPEIYGHIWDDFKLNFALHEQHLSVDADLTFKLAANGYLDSGDFDLVAELDQTDLAPYLSIVADQHWKGRLTGRLQAKGNWHQPERIDASALFSDANLIYQEVDLLSFDRLEARLKNGKIDLPETKMKLMQNGHLTVAVNGSIAQRLTARVGGRLPLAALDPFSDAIGNAAGNILFQIEGEGPWERMNWQGDLTMDELKCELTDIGQSLHSVNGQVTFTPEQVSIASISGKLDDGSFHLDGLIGLADMRPAKADLRFQAHALPLHWPDTMDAKIAADMTLRGDTRDTLLDGSVVLLEGAYYKNLRFNLLSTLTESQRAEPVPSRWEAPEWMNHIRLGVTLTHRYPLLVDNNLARMEVAPDLKLSGTAARPILSGRAQVTDGEVIFRKKSFEVKRGVLDFINPYKIEPLIDIQAETQIRKWQIRLSAQGTPENLKIKLSSDPSESDANILSLILLGQTSSELSNNGGGGGATTGQMLAALATSAWGEDIKKGTGVDILEVETGAQADEEESDRIQVTLGKKLTSRLTFKYALESDRKKRIEKLKRIQKNLAQQGSWCSGPFPNTAFSNTCRPAVFRTRQETTAASFCFVLNSDNPELMFRSGTGLNTAPFAGYKAMSLT